MQKVARAGVVRRQDYATWRHRLKPAMAPQDAVAPLAGMLRDANSGSVAATSGYAACKVGRKADSAVGRLLAACCKQHPGVT